MAKLNRSKRPVPYGTATIDRIMAKVSMEPNSGCWLWLEATDLKGYALMIVNGKTKRVHRLAYESLVGPIPDGLQLDHLCRVRCCVNPKHLEPVTNRENGRRGIASQVNSDRQKAATHCRRGHPYDSQSKRTNGSRECKVCAKNNQDKMRGRRKRVDGVLHTLMPDGTLRPPKPRLSHQPSAVGQYPEPRDRNQTQQSQFPCCS
jgi:hypothetical protein